MSVFDARQATAQLRRLQLLLAVIIFWDLLALAGEVSFGGPLMHIGGDKVAGLLASRASFSGAALVPISVYLYGLARNPIRHRGALLVAVVEQLAAVLFAIYHFAADDIAGEAAIAGAVMSTLLLVLLLFNMPRTSTGS